MSVILNPFQLLELKITSAQDLAIVARSMRTYAVAWVHPDRRLSTRVDPNGRNNPTWNDKFVFRVDEEFLNSESSAIVIEIYAVHWLKDVAVGTVRVLVNDVLPNQPLRPFQPQQHVGMQFVTLQVRRPSGRPQGILNIGVSVLNSSMRSMPLNTSSVGMGNDDKKRPKQKHKQKEDNLPLLRRSKSDSSSLLLGGAASKPKKPIKRKVSIREKATSLVNASEVSSTYQLLRKKKGSSQVSSSVTGSEVVTGRKKKGSSQVSSSVNGSEVVTGKKGGKSKRRGPFITDSELGPSPSEVAADLAKKERQRPDPDAESSIIAWSVNAESVEGLQSKLERWRAEVPAIYDRGTGPASYEPSSVNRSEVGGGDGDGHGRRHTDGGEGLFSCFSNVCGCECSISIGNPSKKSGKKGRRRSQSSPASESYV